MTNLSGKRFLLLGRSIWKKAIKDFAEKHNIALIATGNDTSAGIFEIAHEAYNVDSIDRKCMCKLLLYRYI
ncbi:putative uncharacterized protein [Odoribacter laneus CAG:561]|nr:putative uncharacterized protein [Odoribacter laneus CAG:561]